MIPIRVPANAPLHTVGGIRILDDQHPLYWEDCPVCDEPIGSRPLTLVYVGVLPEDRKERGWTTGAAVAVHAACAGLDTDQQSASDDTEGEAGR